MNLSRLRAVGLFAVLAWLLGSSPAAAGTLQATITGSSGKPLRDVRIELIGPAKKTLFTTEEGMVTLELPGGSYILRIINAGHQVELQLQVPQEGKISPSLELGW